MYACRAPEQADADLGARGPHSDVWGFAAIMLHLATGELPYKDLTFVQVVRAMMKGTPPSVPDTLPPWLQPLLKQCFSFDVTKRPPVPQLLQVWTLSLCGLGHTFHLFHGCHPLVQSANMIMT